VLTDALTVGIFAGLLQIAAIPPRAIGTVELATLIMYFLQQRTGGSIHT
jgi:hypothetical protein